MKGGRHLLRPPGSRSISNLHLGAYVEAAMLDVIHDDSLTAEEKAAGLAALARFARSVSDHWRVVSNYYGGSAERIWHRMAGLTPEGHVTQAMSERLAEVADESGAHKEEARDD